MSLGKVLTIKIKTHFSECPTYFLKKLCEIVTIFTWKVGFYFFCFVKQSSSNLGFSTVTELYHFQKIYK